jgi:preprotein translocase subunit YajC
VTFTPLFAQDPGTPPAGDTTGQPGAAGAEGKAPPQVPFIMRSEVMAVLMGLMVVFMLISGRKRKKEEEAKRAQMKSGSKIMTNSGIIGRIVSMKDGDTEVVIKSEDTKLRILKSTIASVINDDTPATETKA